MNGRCKDCKYWVPAEECDEFQAGDCQCPKFSGGNYREDLDADGLFVGAYDDFLVFITGPEFGCVHFEEGENARTTERG